MLITTFVLGSLIGVTLGLTGAGGGILAIPALMLSLGWTMEQAAPVALFAVASAAAVGAFSAHRKGLVRYRAAALISITGILSVPLGQHWAHRLPERWLTLIFATTMVIVALRLWRSASTQTLSDDDTDLRPRKINVQTGRIVWNVTSFATLSAIGIVTGLTTGLLSVGGGFIIVPALLRCSNITLAGIVATSLMVIALISSGAFVSAWATNHVHISSAAGLFIVGMVLSMSVSRHYAKEIPKLYTLRFFSLLIVTISIAMLYKVLN